MIKNHWYLLLFLIPLNTLKAQKLPEPVTNNAVVALQKEGRTVVYSFYGLDSSKRWSGVHNKVFKIDLKTRRSTTLNPLPDTLGRLAAAASVIKNKAYIVGGYAVFQNGKEKSSKRLFIFDPEHEKITEGASLPFAIDDHIQGVWRDSLLYVISGWSDSLNVNLVQMYNPANNKWSLATQLPDEPGAKVFGGSGTIVGDTIYMLGGATFSNYYPPSRSFYKGVISPVNAALIQWQRGTDYPGEYRYRSVMYFYKGNLEIAGGSNETYNYNGIDYANKKPVEPNGTDLIYMIRTGRFSTRKSAGKKMDLRNVAISSDGHVYSIGGMEPKQKVSHRIVRIH